MLTDVLIVFGLVMLLVCMAKIEAIYKRTKQIDERLERWEREYD